MCVGRAEVLPSTDGVDRDTETRISSAPIPASPRLVRRTKTDFFRHGTKISVRCLTFCLKHDKLRLFGGARAFGIQGSGRPQAISRKLSVLSRLGISYKGLLSNLAPAQGSSG